MLNGMKYFARVRRGIAKFKQKRADLKKLGGSQTEYKKFNASQFHFVEDYLLHGDTKEPMNFCVTTPPAYR